MFFYPKMNKKDPSCYSIQMNEENFWIRSKWMLAIVSGFTNSVHAESVFVTVEIPSYGNPILTVSTSVVQTDQLTYQWNTSVYPQKFSLWLCRVNRKVLKEQKRFECVGKYISILHFKECCSQGRVALELPEENFQRSICLPTTEFQQLCNKRPSIWAPS